VPPFAETISYVRRVKQTYNQRKASTPPVKINFSGGAAALATVAPSR
jgi:hypothetical protein